MIGSGLACSSSGLGSVANLASTECLKRTVGHSLTVLEGYAAQ